MYTNSDLKYVQKFQYAQVCSANRCTAEIFTNCYIHKLLYAHFVHYTLNPVDQKWILPFGGAHFLQFVHFFNANTIYGQKLNI